MRWAGHLVRTDASKLAKRAEVEKHQGRRKRGRPQLRWEDCVRRDMRRSEEDERWREGAGDRKPWKGRTERVVRSSPLYCRDQGGRANISYNGNNDDNNNNKTNYISYNGNNDDDNNNENTDIG